MNFLTILLRVRNENLFLESFVKHYFHEDVDEIHILDDNSTEPYPEYVAQAILKSLCMRRLHFKELFITKN